MKHLSRFDIEAIAAKYVKAYMELPDVRNTKKYRIDPELLLEKVLGLTVEYQHLSYDGSILGMTSFTELGVQVLEDDDNEAFFFLDGKTVLVEKDLAFDNKLRGRKNFTLMHEGSHQIFKMLFPNDYGITEKSAGVHYYKATADTEKSRIITDWEEWQANTLAAELLMPTFLVNAEIERAALCLPNGILYKSASDPNYEKILEMARRIGVSWSAIRIRLQQMQVIKGKPIHCHPLDIMRFGE